MLKIAFEKLRVKFETIKILIAIGLVATLGITVTNAAVSSSNKAASLKVAFANAERFLDQGEWLAAKEIVDKVATESQTSDTLIKIEKLTKTITALKESQESFANGEFLNTGKQYLASIAAYSKVLVADESNYQNALEKIKVLQPLAIRQSLEQANELSREKRIAEAIDVLDQAIEIAGYDSRLTKAKATIEKAQADYVKAQAAYKKRLRSQAISKMSKKRDSFESITWYRDRSSPRYTNQNAFYLYFGVSDGVANNLRMRVQYFDDDWLFVESAKVNIDGEVFTLSCTDWERDNNQDIWEWCDIQLDNRPMIEAIIKSRNAVIKFDGDQYYDTRTITQSQKRAMKNVLKAYDVF